MCAQTTWWLERIQQFEMMPNKRGLILYPPCVQRKVFKNEFRVEMIECLGKSYWLPPEDHPNADDYGIASWYDGQACALKELAKIYFAQKHFDHVPTLKLKMRTLHHDFGHCDECNDIQSERTDIRKQRLGPEALAANDERARNHAEMYMGERRGLETLRLSAGRDEVLFCMRDKCGDDCLYLPSVPRKKLGNKSKYQWRMAAQFELYPGKLTQINLLPAHCVAGSNFGCSSLLSGWCSLMDAGIWTQATSRVILNEDGGSENVNHVHHALCMTAIKEIKTLNEIFVPRLPPEHHHDWADTTISVLEGALDEPGFGGVETLPDMQHFIRQLFSQSKAYGDTAIVVNMQMANHNFSSWFNGHVDGAFGRFGKPHVWRYSRHPVTNEPTAHYKYLIQHKKTFWRDEWGPWVEQYVTRTNEHGQLEHNVRVLRTDPEGHPFMLSYPNITDDPGYEDWHSDEDWSRAAVFDSLLRTYNYSKQKLDTATSPHGPKDSWQALASFYAAHQTSDTLPPMPFNLTTPAGATIELAGYPLEGGWAAMWRKLKQFNDEASPANSATANSSAVVTAHTANSSTIVTTHTAPTATCTAIGYKPAPGDPANSNQPRASVLNHVNRK
jgi:hypothetical protein